MTEKIRDFILPGSRMRFAGTIFMSSVLRDRWWNMSEERDTNGFYTDLQNKLMFLNYTVWHLRTDHPPKQSMILPVIICQLKSQMKPSAPSRSHNSWHFGVKCDRVSSHSSFHELLFFHTPNLICCNLRSGFFTLVPFLLYDMNGHHFMSWIEWSVTNCFRIYPSANCNLHCSLYHSICDLFKVSVQNLACIFTGQSNFWCCILNVLTPSCSFPTVFEILKQLQLPG